MNLRRLNDTGIQQLIAFLDAVRAGTATQRPTTMLSDPVLSDEVTPTVDIEERTFGSRFEAAKYFSDKFEAVGLREVHRDRGLWAWLSLYYFEELCPPDRRGTRQPGEQARWVPESRVFRFYRHLIAGPYVIYRAYRDQPDQALAVLCQPLDKPGDIVAQLASRQEFLMNRPMMEAATQLYVDPETRRLKRGAQTRGKGSTIRLVDVADQFDVTFDLYAMSSTDLLGLLPPQFDRFRTSS
jgi:hypothetical protein